MTTSCHNSFRDFRIRHLVIGLLVSEYYFGNLVYVCGMDLLF